VCLIDGYEYQQCCGPFHSGEKIPATAEALMLFALYGLCLAQCRLFAGDWDATKRPEKIDFSREKIDWLDWKLLTSKKAGSRTIKACVVKAFYSQDGEEHVMNEISRFTKINGRWFYLDGVIKSMGKVGLQTNQGKNALCSCAAARNLNAVRAE